MLWSIGECLWTGEPGVVIRKGSHRYSCSRSSTDACIEPLYSGVDGLLLLEAAQETIWIFNSFIGCRQGMTLAA